MAWLVSEMVCYAVNFIMIAISVYLIICQCKHNQEMYMTKRSPSLYYLLNVSLVLTMIGVTVIFKGLISGTPIHQTIICVCAILFIFTFLFALLVKNWLIYYKYKWTYYTMEYQWRYIINSKLCKTESDKNWFISNNSTYGNLWYIYKLFGIMNFIFYVIYASCVGSITYFEFDFIVVIIGCSIALPMFSMIAVFYLYLVRNTPSLDDCYKIHWESKIHSKLLLLWCIFLILANTAYIVSQNFHAYLEK